jgi:hypothetical protein
MCSSLWACQIRQIVRTIGACCTSGIELSRFRSHSWPVFFRSTSGGRGQTCVVACHKHRAWGQRIKTWKVSSDSDPHIGQRLDKEILRLARFTCVAIALRQIFQASNLTSGGTW